MRHTILVASVIALMASLTMVGIASSQEAPRFQLGFLDFAQANPDLVGQPVENERHDVIGNGFQQTTTGLLVWHRLDNTTDFTNGFQTFVLTSDGLLERSNEERFEFEVVREQLEQQLEAQIDALISLQPDQLQEQIDALIQQTQEQVELQVEQLQQPDAIVEQPEQAPGPVTFRVTVDNLTIGQPFSPIVAATHEETVRLFEVGATASDEIAAVARDGNAGPLFSLANALPGVTEAVNLGMEVLPGQSASFEIQAVPGDVFSMASMLGCTNDGFWGLDSVELPESGTLVYETVGWDAGRENNTERIEDLPDRCGIPVGEATNRNAEVATIPFEPIRLHPGIQGVGEGGLDPATRGWTDPVATMTIERIGS